MSIKSNLLLGAHVSIADSIDMAIDRGQSLGCTAIQIFVKNNRQWSKPKFSNKDAEKFKIKKIKSNIKEIVIHASYLINLCSQNSDVVEKSIESLKDELYASELLDIPYLVLHPGSSKNIDSPKIIAGIINSIYQENNFKTMILLETMSGQGTSIGKNFNELKEILNNIDQQFENRVGICFDTCHVFAAGYNLNSYENIIELFDKVIGLRKLKAFHLNDSKRELGSLIDRHENIGQGKIGIKFFELLMNDPRFKNHPKIIETPKKGPEEDLKNLEILKKLIK